MACPATSLFGISAAKAVGLARDVEMYQWVESSESKTEKKIGGGEETTTTYSYQKEWRSGGVDSSRFKRPTIMPTPTPCRMARPSLPMPPHVGAFSVPAGWWPISVSALQSRPTDADAAEATKRLSANRPVKRDGQGLYVGQSSTSPDIGDLKISFERIDAKAGKFRRQAERRGAHRLYLQKWPRYLLSAAGDADAVSMFKAAQSENTVITWILRLVGLLVMFIGFVLMFAIFGVLADIIPFVGSIVSFGTSLFAFVLTLLLGAVVIAIGWVAYRPLVAIGILVAAAVVALDGGRDRDRTCDPYDVNVVLSR
jgi:hypothetical protein